MTNYPVKEVSTTFEIQRLDKGTVETNHIVLTHYLWNPKRSDGFLAWSMGGPVEFDFRRHKGRTFLAYLKRGKNGQLLPTTGHWDFARSFQEATILRRKKRGPTKLLENVGTSAPNSQH